MTIAIDGIPEFMGLTAGRVFRVGNAAIAVSGNRVSAVNDDGLVFDTVEFADGSGLGLGRVTPFHVLDNEDGTMNLYYQVYDAEPLPAFYSNWVVTLDAATGLATGAATELTTGPLGDTDHAMLLAALSLPDGNIAVLNHDGLAIADPAGGEVHAPIAPGLDTSSHTFDWQLVLSMAVAGNTFALASARTVGTGEPGSVRFFNFDGTPATDAISVGSPGSTAFGNTPAVQIAGLSNGKLVVAWVETDHAGIDEDETSTWFKILNTDGTVAVADTLVNEEITRGRQDMPIVVATETGFVIGYSVLTFSAPGVNEGRLKEYSSDGTLLDSLTGAYRWSVDDIVRTDNNTAIIVGGEVTEIILPGADTPITNVAPPSGMDITGSAEADVLTGATGDDRLNGLDGNDRLVGEAGNDTLLGGDGADTLNGGDGDDMITGGATDADLRDVIFGGDGHDSIDAGHGNDLVSGQDGDDTIAGGFGVDELQGQNGDDVITGSAYSDLVFGGAGDDFVNGGFGHDRINGGSGADKIFHVGGTEDQMLGHGSDWVQDYNAAEGDVLLFGDAAATADQFQVNTAHTANGEGERSGDDTVEEAFVIYRPTGQILWALVDGDGQAQINLQIGTDVFDLMG